MAEGDGKTVLVTGGSGYLAGWCIVGLLERGYRVRTTVRSAGREREVRVSVGSRVDAHHDLSVHVADLMSDEHWQHAIEGCDYALHVASPFPPKQPKDPDELIVPAREGTIRVLGAALDAGVERVVVTSSIAAITGASDAAVRTLDEADWSALENPRLSPYARSKTIAERAAWELVERRGERNRLAVVNPGAIIGPVLSDDLSYSLQVVQRLMGGLPGVPRLGFNLVDVRDIAELELAAMTRPVAGGERFIGVTGWLWMSEIAEVLRRRLGERARKVRTRTVPDLLVRAMGLFDSGIRSQVSGLGVRTEISSEKVRSTLGWSPRPLEDTIAETAESLIAHGVTKAPAPSATT